MCARACAGSTLIIIIIIIIIIVIIIIIIIIMRARAARAHLYGPDKPYKRRCRRRDRRRNGFASVKQALLSFARNSATALSSP